MGEEPTTQKIQGQPPYSLAMLVADAIYSDPATNKKTIMGVFSALAANQFPIAVPQMAVYLALTDGRGKVPLKLRLVDTNEERDPIIEADMVLDFTDPRMILEGAMSMRNVVFPLPGEYRVELTAFGQFIIERRLIVIDTSSNLGMAND